jgi:hypothetical protein
MITISECAAFAGLASNELVLGAVPASRHHCLLASYLLNSHRGLDAVRAMIVSDLRGYLDLGASSCAADLLIVLRMFLTDFPEARLGGRGRSETRSRVLREMALLEDFEHFERDAAEGVVISFWRNRPRDGRRARLVGRRDADFGGDRAVARLSSRASVLRSDG